MGPKLTSPNFIAPLCTTLVAAAALAGLAFPAGASAETRADQRVAYADLDLSSPAGARIMLTRIHAAADRACVTGVEHSPLHPRALARQRACAAEAMNLTVKRLNAPLVLALHTNQPTVGVSLAAR